MNNLLKRPPGSVVEPMQKLLDIVNRVCLYFIFHKNVLRIEKGCFFLG